MSGKTVRIDDEDLVVSTIGRNDRLVVVANTEGEAEFRTANLATVLADPNNQLSVCNLVLTKNAAPANSTAVSVAAGTIWSDGSFIYFASANNTVKRAALSSF